MTTCRQEQQLNSKNLRAKGWTEIQIRNAKNKMRKIHKAKHTKHKTIQELDKTIYWLLLALSLLGNFIISVTLIPVLLVFTGKYLIFTLIFTGLAFGWIFTKLVIEIEHFQSKKTIILELLIPVVGLINVYLITFITNKLAPLLGLTGGIHNPLSISFIYVLSFSIPRIHDILTKKQKNKI